jgi:hypothetical protein
MDSLMFNALSEFKFVVTLQTDYISRIELYGRCCLQNSIVVALIIVFNMKYGSS